MFWKYTIDESIHSMERRDFFFFVPVVSRKLKLAALVGKEKRKKLAEHEAHD